MKKFKLPEIKFKKPVWKLPRFGKSKAEVAPSSDETVAGETVSEPKATPEQSVKKFKLPEFKFKKPVWKLPLFGKRKTEAVPSGESIASKFVSKPTTASQPEKLGIQLIAVNLHNYRFELVKVGIQKYILKACALTVACVIFAAAHWLVAQDEIERKKIEIEELNQQVNALESDFKAVKSMQEKSKRLLQIVDGIQKLRNGQLETTRVLNDLYLQIPDDIWLTSVEQRNWKDLKRKRIPYILFEDPDIKNQKKKKKKKDDEEDSSLFYEFIEINGKAAGMNASNSVAQLTRNLSLIPYFKKVFILKTQDGETAGVPTVKFSIYCYMPLQSVKTA
jgi:hypothetical protein